DDERRESRAQNLVYLVTGVVAMATIALADVEKERGQAVNVAAERFAHRDLTFVVGDGGVIARFAGEVTVELVQRLLARRIDEQTAGDIQKVVSAGAVDRPGFPQLFATRQNLLRDDPALRCRSP